MDPVVEVSLSHAKRVNFAMQQNAVPMVQRLSLRNTGKKDLEELRVALWCEPEVAERCELAVARIPAGEAYNIDRIDLPLRPDRLVEQIEREVGRLCVAVTTADGDVLARRDHDIEVLAYDEWSGAGSLPELLAAFVLPNHPVVEQVLAAARDRLEQATGSPTLDGYLSRDPARARAVAEAVYDTLRGLDLTYVHPPASFEREGQKVRTPDRLVSARLATCLDSTLLFAACLEQAGLNALLVLVADHAFAGVWLTGETFPEPVVAEPLRLRQRIDLETLLVIETTGVTARPQLTFAQAAKAAEQRLEDPSRFEYAVDLRGARQVRIRPIPLRAAEGTYEVVVEQPGDTADPDAAVVAVGEAEPAEEERETPRTRLDRWKRKLLDLSLRNRLINYRETKKTIPLLCPDLAGLEDALAEGATFRIEAVPELMGEDDPRDGELHRSRTGEDARESFLREELAARRLHADLGAEELERRLIETYRAARLGLEESGANTLYLALGFLRWYETPSSDRERLAPILLLPLELERKSIRSGFRVRLLDEEARVNVTLLQKLESDYGLRIKGLDLLPQDASGLDVKAILKTVREAVLPLERWTVADEAALGLFSFTKFLMWLDLEERAEILKRNEVVRHLVERPDEEFDEGAVFPAEATLDSAFDPAATYCPLDADSSQLAAIHAAADGRTFVLEGPPGTGKSQTITNVIAHCLASGQRVLFVSAKMAALKVVHRRLQRVGLAPFCLELHSNRSSKRQVLAQLGEALETTGHAGPSGWEDRAGKLATLREKLNGYCSALHAPRDSGLSAFRGLAELAGLRRRLEVGLDLDDPLGMPAAEWERRRDAVEVLEAEARALGEVARHPLLCVLRDDWHPALGDEVAECAGRLEQAVEDHHAAIEPIADAMALEPAAWSAVDLERMSAWCELMGPGPVPAPAALTEPDWTDAKQRLKEAVANGRERDVLRDRLFALYRPELLDLHLGYLRARLERSRGRFFLLRWLIARPARKALAAMRLGGGRLANNDELMSHVDEAAELRRRTNEGSQLGPECEAAFGRHWRGGEADWDILDRLLAWIDRFRDLLDGAAGTDLDLRVRLRDAWTHRVATTEARALLATDMKHLCYTRAALDTARAGLEELLSLDAARAFGAREAAGHLERVLDTADACRRNSGKLRSWCRYRAATHEAGDLGLAELVRALEDGRVSEEELGPVLERSLLDTWIGALLAAEPVLGNFSGTRHELDIRNFARLDREVMRLTTRVLRARLASRVPREGAEGTRSPSSEMGLLHRELGKRRRHLPVRQLFQRIPNVLPRIKPCMLMSPLSVAQYLAPDTAAFDLVVFDEASQLPAWDAIGAIARGQRLVVVGDTKQLPPTTFFSRAESEEILDEGEIEDLESILDECVAVRLPRRQLKWHYRSRHEELIAFSNYHYYGNRLLTFPSVVGESDRMGVFLRSVPDGIYDKGRTRTNRREAEELVEEVVSRLGDPEESRRSIGIVTFSIAQQTLIEDLLDEARRHHPAIDTHFTSEVEEPVFIKNLENVQGDERDVILFSVCYGPDETGRVSMNFGPLNKGGGERRLNVAITRAREQVVVFSNLRPDQIDLARTRAVGVRHLRTFLEYARSGAAAIAESSAVPAEAAATPFEIAVRRSLEARGWTVDAQVGCSGYRIDLAVRHPEDPHRYLCGIECDGAMYSGAKTARDRDRLRTAVLRSLGWRLHRVWSTDWHYEPERELETIEAALRDALRGSVPPTPETEVPVDAPGEPTEKTASPCRPYAPLEAAAPVGTPEDFHDPAQTAKLRRVLRKALAREAPIALELLARRAAAAFDVGRVTARVADRVQERLAEAGGILRGEVVWLSDQDPREYRVFRVPPEGAEANRQAEEIPVEEIASAAEYLLSAHVSIRREDLARETARLFGFGRLGSKVQRAMETGIDALAAREGCRLEGEMAVATPKERTR